MCGCIRHPRPLHDCSLGDPRSRPWSIVVNECVCNLVRKCMETKRERGAELHGSHYVLVCVPGFQPLSGSAGLPGTSAARGRRCKLREVLSRISNNEAASSQKVPFQETREMMETLAARLQRPYGECIVSLGNSLEKSFAALGRLYGPQASFGGPPRRPKGPALVRTGPQAQRPEAA